MNKVNLLQLVHYMRIIGGNEKLTLIDAFLLRLVRSERCNAHIRFRMNQSEGDIPKAGIKSTVVS